MSILIISESHEPSTNIVVRWLSHLKKKFIRINQDDSYWFTRHISNSESSIEIRGGSFVLENETIDSIWHRRGSIKIAVDPTNGSTEKLLSNIREYLIGEAKAVQTDIYNKLNTHASTNITKYDVLNENKLEVLDKAREVGLKIPDTIITNNKIDLLSFIQKKGKCICKAVNANFSFRLEDHNLSHYTTTIDYNDIVNEYEGYIFPSIVQEYIEKKFEIRTFVFDNSLYSMAIFSQQNERTKIDYRNQDFSRFNRVVPYKIPIEIEKNILKLFKLLSLNTGSIDMIYTPNKEYVFLEVNPVGQFGMVSTPCNYYLEKKIAEYLAYGTTS